MQRRSSSVNVSLEEGSHRDVGVLELVADPQTGKRGIRRVFPETMNGVQPDPDTNSTVHPNGDVGVVEPGRRRPSLAIRTQTLPESPLQTPTLPRQETSSTLQSTTPKPPQRLNVMRTLRDSFMWKNDPNDGAPDRPLDLGSPLISGLPYANGSIQALGNAWKGKEKEVVGLFQDNEGDKLSVVMDDARKNRLATKAREIRQWVKGRSMHRTANRNTTVNGTAHANGNDNSNGHANGNITQNKDNKRKPGPSNTGGGMRDLFKGRRQNTANSATAGPSSAPVSTPIPATPAAAPPRKDQGPRPGQTYEIYEQRIIENNPERTVEISTWREQIPIKRDPSDQQDKISIYYISADDYPPEDRPMAKVEWRVDGGEMSPIVAGSPVTTRSANLLGANIHGRPTRPSHPRHASSYHSRASDPRNRHSYYGHVPETPTVRRDKGAHSAHKVNGRRPHRPPSNQGSQGGASSSRLASPITPTRTREGTISPSSSERGLSITSSDKTPVPEPAQQQHSGSKFVESIISVPSSPIRRQASKTGAPQRGLRHTGRGELFPNESTPVATASAGPPATANGTGFSGLSPPSINSPGGGRSVSAPPSNSPPALTVVTTTPFNATRESGSAISSIKSFGSVQFEAVLQSCEPSLSHIGPALRQLGIRHLEHLRAVGKLTPTTRDREVKEGALKLGITVVEWAILLDRIFTLL